MTAFHLPPITSKAGPTPQFVGRCAISPCSFITYQLVSTALYCRYLTVGKRSFTIRAVLTQRSNPHEFSHCAWPWFHGLCDRPPVRRARPPRHRLEPQRRQGGCAGRPGRDARRERGGRDPREQTGRDVRVRLRRG